MSRTRALAMLLLLVLSAVVGFADQSSVVVVTSDRDHDQSVSANHPATDDDGQRRVLQTSRDSGSSPTPSSGLDLASLLDFGGQPFKMVLPNTVQGIQADVSNGYASGLGGLQSTYGSMNDGFVNRYKQLQNALNEREETLVRLASTILQDPQQFCAQVQSSAIKFGQQAQQSGLANGLGSLAKQFGSFSSPFG